MAQRRNMRIIDDGDAGRSTPFSVPGYPSGAGRRPRSSSRVGASRRRPEIVTVGSMPSGTSIPERPGVRPVRPGLIAGAVFLLVCICALVAFVLSSNANGGKGTTNEQVVNTTGAAIAGMQAAGEIGFSTPIASAPSFVSGHSSLNSYELSSDDLLDIPGTDAVSVLNLNSGSAAVETPAFSTEGIRAAVSSIEELGDCGFVFLDVDSGYGLVYNADEAMYIASAAKAPFIYWLAASGHELDEYDEELVEYTIVDSDNDSFFSLFGSYFNDGYAEFMASYGVQHDDYQADYFPRMSARGIAGVWADILNYMRGESSTAEWLSSLFGATETSFIRDGLYDTGAIVLDKAGWIDEPDYDGDYDYDEEQGDYVASGGYVSVTDAAVVRADGRTYLMAIVTSQSDSGIAEANVSALARALFEAREAM